VSSDNESSFSEKMFQAQQSTQSDLTDEIFLQQANFKKNSNPKLKSVKKYLKKNPRNRMHRVKSIDVSHISFLGGSHHLNEITNKFAQKLKEDEENKSLEDSNHLNEINENLVMSDEKKDIGRHVSFMEDEENKNKEKKNERICCTSLTKSKLSFQELPGRSSI